MIGYDFYVFWLIGQKVLGGGNPYTADVSLYPPVTSYVFAVFGLLPFQLSYAIWVGGNVLFCLSSFRRLSLNRPAWSWLFFAPVLFNILTGQIDLLFMWLAVFLPAGGWGAVIAAILITMKPQIAVILLPWFLIRWLKTNRRLVIYWLAGTLAFQLLPLIFSPSIFQDWFISLQGLTESRMGFSAGIFSWSALGLPLWLAGIIAAGIAIWGLFQDEMTSRAAQLFAFPATIWYEDALLAGSVPPLLLIPYSLLAFLASILVSNSVPLATIPLVVFVYRLVEQRRKRVSLST